MTSMKAESNIVLKAKSRAHRLVIGDLVFALLPALVLFLTRLATLKFNDILTRSDWSYVALILFGQALAKFVFGVAENRSTKSSSTIVLITILLFAFGCVPTGVILVLIETSSNKSYILIGLQIFLLLAAIFTYFNIGAIGYMLGENKNLKFEEVIAAEIIEQDSK